MGEVCEAAGVVGGGGHVGGAETGVVGNNNVEVRVERGMR